MLIDNFFNDPSYVMMLLGHLILSNLVFIGEHRCGDESKKTISHSSKFQ